MIQKSNDTINKQQYKVLKIIQNLGSAGTHKNIIEIEIRWGSE